MIPVKFWIPLLFLVAFATVTGYFLVQKAQQTEKEIEAVSRFEPIRHEEQAALGDSDLLDMSKWKTYRNEEYGFSLQLPGEIDKWNITKRTLSKFESMFGSENEAMLEFSYMLDSPVARVSQDPSMGFLQNMIVWYVDIIPKKDWKEGICEKFSSPRPLCRQGKVIGTDDRYVFEQGFLSIEGAGYLCAGDQKDVQKSFCTMYHLLSNAVIGEKMRISMGR